MANGRFDDLRIETLTLSLPRMSLCLVAGVGLAKAAALRCLSRCRRRRPPQRVRSHAVCQGAGTIPAWKPAAVAGGVSSWADVAKTPPAVTPPAGGWCASPLKHKACRNIGAAFVPSVAFALAADQQKGKENAVGTRGGGDVRRGVRYRAVRRGVAVATTAIVAGTAAPARGNAAPVAALRTPELKRAGSAAPLVDLRT